MTHRLLQPHFFLRALRAQARYACRRATRASALRAHGTHLCELSDNHSSSDDRLLEEETSLSADLPPASRGVVRQSRSSPSPSCCSLHGRSRASSLPARRPCASACPNAACGTGVGLCRGWTVRLSEHGRSPGGASRATRTTPHLCRAAVDSLAHSSDLPPALVAKVPQREKLILSFVLAFIKDQAPPHPARALCPRPRPLLPPPPLPSARALQASALALCPPAPALALAFCPRPRSRPHPTRAPALAPALAPARALARALRPQPSPRQ